MTIQTSNEDAIDARHLPGTITEVQEQQALSQLFNDLSTTLRQKASSLVRNERVPAFATWDLINDLYLRLSRNPAYALVIAAKGRLDFIRMASTAMRHILTDAARRREAGRNGGDFAFVSLNHVDERTVVQLSPERLLDLDAALRALEEKHPRRAAIISMRFYGGLSVREIQEYWGVADATVERDIRLGLKLLSALMLPPDQSKP